MSEYSKLKQKGMGRGRPAYTPEQKEEAHARNLIRQEARRRAHIVLKNRHLDEYSEIYEAEMAELSKEPVATKRAKRTRK